MTIRFTCRACRTSRATSISAPIAEAAASSGLNVLGYASQAHFLTNCGLTDLLARTPADDARAYLPLARQVDKLTSPAEMGELFKVIALGRGCRNRCWGLPAATGALAAL